MWLKPGEMFHKHNENGTIFSGIILTVFQDLSGRWMYLAQRPSDGMKFSGFVPAETKVLPKVTYGEGKY